MGFLDKLFRKRRADHKRDEAIDFEIGHEYADAAQAYAKRASIDLPHNELMFADDCLSSAIDWIKAGNADEALGEARRALQGYLLGDWLKKDEDDDGEYLKSLTDMVAALRQAGYTKESDAFLSDINNALIKIGEKPISVMVMGTENRFPNACPHCGADVSYRGNLDEINCPFCGGAIHAL